MAVQGFFSPDKKSRMAGEKENRVALGGDNLGSVGAITAVGAIGSLGIKGIKSAIEGGKRLKENIERRVNPDRETSFFSPRGNEIAQIASSDISNLRVGSPEVRIANVKSYTGSDTKPYAPDRVGDYIRDSETRPSYTPEKDTGYGSSLEKSIDNLDRFDRKFYNIDKETKEYGVPMSKEEKRVTTAYTLTNPDKNYWSSSYKFSDTNYDKIQSDYNKYKDLRERRDTRREAEEAVTAWENKAYADFDRADYAIKMKQYNPDGTEKDINKYNQTLDQQLADLKRVRYANETLVDMSKRYPTYYKENFSDDGLYGLSRFGKVVPQSEINAYEKKVAAEEAERTRLSSEKAKSDYEESQKNVFQKIGDTVGNVFNTLTGTLPAKGDTLQAQGINTSATTNIAQMGNVSPSVQRAREAVEKSVRQQTGMPSNPGSQRQTGVGKSAGNLSRHKAGPSRSRGGISKSTSRGQGGGTSSRSKGGVSRGGSKASSSSSRGQGGGTASRSKGGSFGGSRRSTNRSKSRRQCDIRTKINISPLINSNLVKDNLAEVAYFVQEIRK